MDNGVGVLDGVGGKTAPVKLGADARLSRILKPLEEVLARRLV
jgi:hypothetical protein